MILKRWNDLPKNMQTEEVREYYEILERKKVSLFLKRSFDIVISLFMLIVLWPVFLILAVAIKLDSAGPVFYRQERVTQYGRVFRIFKFRTMVQNADKGLHITVGDDARITRVGKVIRKYRLDEISQLIDVLRGTMTFVGTRPEAVKYVQQYSDEMMATLLLPAGITSKASICYKDENELLKNTKNPEQVYMEIILPKKMEYNLEAIKSFSFMKEIGLMFQTILEVLK